MAEARRATGIVLRAQERRGWLGRGKPGRGWHSQIRSLVRRLAVRCVRVVA